MTTLDTFLDKNHGVKPQVMTLAHAMYLYEQSYGRQVEKMYEHQIQEKLAEERKEAQSHKDYVERNYIRIGGN